MAHFAVIVQRGGPWDWSRPLRAQQAWDAHAAFMDELTREGFIVAGGPLGEEDTALRILHIVDAPDEIAVRERFAADPWHQNGMLQIVSAEPWTLLLGSLAARRGETAGVIGFPPLIYAVPLGVAIVVDRQAAWPRLPRAAVLAGIVCLGGAAALVASSFAAFSKRDTPVDPYEVTTAIVQDGPFARTRNPIYLGLTLAYCGAALTARARLPFAVLPAVLWVMNRGVIAREERYLEEKFGAEYRAYKDRVRRWL